jgi:methyl-accepting chemotaxis protein
MNEKLTVGELVYKISGDMDNLKTELKKSEAEVGKLKDSMEKTTATTAKMGKQTESTAVSVFKGVAAYDLLKVGIQKVGQFLKESVQASLDAERGLAQTKTNIENAGFAYEDLADTIEESNNKVKGLGFDDEDGQLLSRLVLVTKDMTQAQALLNLSMDLARSKGISLADATKAITLVTQGNNRVLKEYGINLDDTASIADQLTAAQDKLKGSATSYANTVQGQLDIQNEKWKDLKENVGNRLQPVLLKFFDFVETNQASINTLMEAFVSTLEIVIFTVGKLTQFFNVAYNSLKSLAGLIEGTIVKSIQPFVAILEKIGVVSEGTTKAVNDMADSMFQFSKESGDKANTAMSVFLGTAQDTTKASSKLGATIDDTSEALKKIGGASKKSEEDIKSAKQALEDFQNKMVETIDKAKEVRLSLEKDLGNTFSEFATSVKDNFKETTETLAKFVVDAEAKKKELEQQLSLSTDAKEQEDLRKQIADQQSILSSRVGFEDRQSARIAEIRKKLEDAGIDASKAGLEALVTTKTLEQQIQEERANAQLNEFQLFEQNQAQKLVILTDSLIAEVGLLKSKIETQQQYETELTLFLSSEEAKRLKNTEAWAKSTMAKYKEVAQSLQNFLSLKARLEQLSSDTLAPVNASSSASIPASNSSATTTNNRTVNAPVNINVQAKDNLDLKALSREMSFEISRL